MKQKILLVEDEVSFSAIIESKLREHGYKIKTAKTAKAAIETLEKHHFDAIWTDHYMPGKNGLEFVKKLKKYKKFKDIPVFVVSNTADGEDMYEYVRLGVTSYYVKSETKLKDIINDINQALKHQPSIARVE